MADLVRKISRTFPGYLDRILDIGIIVTARNQPFKSKETSNESGKIIG